jgi:hypothetical protein
MKNLNIKNNKILNLSINIIGIGMAGMEMKKDLIFDFIISYIFIFIYLKIINKTKKLYIHTN